MAKRSPYETGELSDSIFLILLATFEPVHGYRIMHDIEPSTHGAVKVGPATMYTTLKKLKATGWIVEIAEEGGRILYAATDEGRAVLRADFSRRKRLVSVAEERLGETTEGGGVMAKYRLCGGLAMMAEHDMGMLKDMSAKGWHVSGLSGGLFYRFEQGVPHDFDYAVGFERDFTPEVQKLFRAGGWHPVIAAPGWQILRAEAGETPLFTDEESKEEALRAVRVRTGRWALVWAALLAVLLAAEMHLDAQGVEPAASACLVGAVAAGAGLTFTALPFFGYTASLRRLRAGR